MVLFVRVNLSQTVLRNPKGQVKLDNPNTSAEVKLYIFFIYSGSRIVCHETKFLNTVNSGIDQIDYLKNFFLQIDEKHCLKLSRVYLQNSQKLISLQKKCLPTFTKLYSKKKINYRFIKLNCE